MFVVEYEDFEGELRSSFHDTLEDAKLDASMKSVFYMYAFISSEDEDTHITFYCGTEDS